MPTVRSARRNTGWSWSSLLKESDGDEERALTLLQYQPGLGSFAGGTSGAAAIAHGTIEAADEIPRDDDIHDEVPCRFEATPPWFMDESYFWGPKHGLPRSWRQWNLWTINMLLDSPYDIAIIRAYDDIIGGAL